MEVIRDLLLEIGINANTEQIVAMQKRINDLVKRIGTYEKVQTKANDEIIRSNRRLIDETQSANKTLGEQSETIRHLAKTAGTSARQMADNWSSMSDEMKKSLIQNHNNLQKYRNDLMNTENDMYKLGNQMGHYTGSTKDFMEETRRLGAEYKKTTEQMINSNMALRQSYIHQAATVLNLSTTSSKITKVYDDTGNALYKVNKPLLAVTDAMENLAKQGNPVVVALKQLGPNASMKELQDRINLINTGIMRQQMLLMVTAVAWAGFTAILANAAMGPDVEKNLAAQAKAWADYQQAVDQRTQEIANAFGLFEQVQIQATNPRRLYLNLQQQIKVMQGWQTNLNTLVKKGVDEGLIAELRRMGPSAAGEIAALTQMSDQGLNEYVAMWKEKHKIARSAATTALEKLRQETAAKVQGLKDSLKPLGIAVYEFKNTWATALTPFIEFWGQMASYVVRAGTKVGEFVQKLNEISPWITKLAGMFAYLSLTLVLLLTPMAVGIGYIQGMRVAFTAAWMMIKPFAIGLASVGGTAMLVAGGLIVAAAAVYLLWTRSETFRNGVISGWQAIQQAAVSVWGFIRPYIMQAIGAVVAFGQQKLAQLRQFWQDNGAQILQAGRNVFGFLGTLIGGVMKGIWSVMKFVWPAVLLIIQSVWNNIKGVVNGGLQVILGVVKFFSSLFTGDFRGMWEATKQIFFGAIQFIWNFVQLTFFGKILGAGKAFILTFRSGFAALWAGIRGIFVSGVTSVRNFFVNGFNGLMRFSSNITTSMTTGILNRFLYMVNQARTIFSMLRQWGESIFRALWNTIRSITGNIVANVRTGFTAMRDRAVQLADNMKTAVTDRFKSIVDAAKALPEKIGNGIKTMAKYATGGIKHLANSLVSGLAQGVNGVGDGINWVFEKIGVETRIPEWTPPKYAKGTNYHPGGPAIVGDGGGPELMRTPAGQVALSPGKATMVNLPRGTEVLPHRETQMLMASTPRYAHGAGHGTEGGLWDATKNLASQGMGAIKSAATGVKDLAVDVFSAMSDPAGLMKKVWSGFSAVFPKMSGAFGEIGGGAVQWVKDKALSFVTDKLTSFMGSGEGYVGGMEKDPHKVGPGSGMGGMMKYVEHYYNQIKDRFGSTHFMGAYNNRNVRGGSSKSMHAYGRAFDVGGSHATMSKIAEFLRTTASDLQYVIYNRRIAGPGMGKGWRAYDGVNPHVDHVHADFKAVSSAGGGAIPNIKGSVAAWRPYIIKAAQQMREAVTPAQVQGILAQIDRESDGNPRIFQGKGVNDINMRNGNPARGLLQYIPSTFRNYMVKGHTDILNGYDQLMAFFNNTNWRKDLPYGKRGWGPTGARKYAKGTNFHTGGLAWVGDGNGPELIQPPKGPAFLSPAVPTLINPQRGTSVLSHEKTMRALNGASNQGEETYNPQPGNTKTVSKSTNVTFAPEINITVEGGSSDASALEQKLKALILQQMQEQWDSNFMRLLIQLGLVEEEV